MAILYVTVLQCTTSDSFVGVQCCHLSHDRLPAIVTVFLVNAGLGPSS